jgi:hypothetical protein
MPKGKREETFECFCDQTIGHLTGVNTTCFWGLLFVLLVVIFAAKISPLLLQTMHGEAFLLVRVLWSAGKRRCEWWWGMELYWWGEVEGMRAARGQSVEVMTGGGKKGKG